MQTVTATYISAHACPGAAADGDGVSVPAAEVVDVFVDAWGNSF
jgi:hypothetical protein